MPSYGTLRRAWLLAATLAAQPVAALPKILALHGGDETIATFQADPGMAALMASLSSQVEFVFVQAPSNVWFPADDSYPTQQISAIDSVVSSQGPFAGILGYSQGATMAIVYSSLAPVGTFPMLVTYCAAPTWVEMPSLRSSVDARSPFAGVAALFFTGSQDSIIRSADTVQASAVFGSPTIVTSPTASHHLPFSTDATYATVLSFITSNLHPSPPAAPAPPLPPYTIPPPSPLPYPPPPPSPPVAAGEGGGGEEQEGEDNPCFPSSALVTLAAPRSDGVGQSSSVTGGTTVRIDSLAEGDTILCATSEGTLTTDTLSFLSIATPHAEHSSFVTLTTHTNDTLTLTHHHHLPIGASCCSTLQRADQVRLGDTLWAVPKAVPNTAASSAAAATAQKVIRIGRSHGVGLHSPLLTHGHLPIVDGLVTAPDAPSAVKLHAALGPYLIPLVRATGTADLVRRAFFAAGRTYIDGYSTAGTGGPTTAKVSQ